MKGALFLLLLPADKTLNCSEIPQQKILLNDMIGAEVERVQKNVVIAL
jgi:hypothetical protein